MEPSLQNKAEDEYEDEDEIDLAADRDRCCSFILYLIILTAVVSWSCYLKYIHFTISLRPPFESIESGNKDRYDWRHKLRRHYKMELMANDNTLRLMSFNLRNMVLDVDEEPYKRWDHRRNAVFHLLNNMKCDVIGTQEGVLPQIEDIADHWSAASRYGHYGNGRLPTEWYLSSLDRMNEHCSIFWDKRKLNVIDEGTFWLSDHPEIAGSKYFGSPLPRIASWMLFEIRNNDKYRMLFISTHLGLDSDVRESQIGLIAKFVHQMTGQQRDEHSKQLLVFVVGDFNEGIGQESWSRLFAGNPNVTSGEEDEVDVSDVLTDCVLEWQSMFNRTLSPNITYHAFEGLGHLKDDTNHAPIDWILCSKNVIENDDILLLDNYIVTGMRRETDGSIVYPSDHFPIVLEIVILDHRANHSLTHRP